MDRLRKDADEIVRAGIARVMPDEAVKRALLDMPVPRGRLVTIAAGKAAWRMAKAACDGLAGMARIDAGIVITKYGHTEGRLPGIECFEAGHPVPDQNGFAATRRAIGLVSGLGPEDQVLFLLSGGGSALFEAPLIPEEELRDITEQLLACGADIVEINTVRKRLSGVKGGRFAEICAPARVFTIVLSDIIGDPLDMIASGPAYPDSSTCADALAAVSKYGLKLSGEALALLSRETPKSLDNVTTVVTGSVRELCRAVSDKCAELGYEPVILTDRLCCEAREAGRMLGEKARKACPDAGNAGRKLAYIAGGETVVHVKGNGLGGRNQEIALAAAPLIAGLEAAVLSFGSDGTDGPTDAAGGYVDGRSMELFGQKGIDPEAALAENDSYHALGAVGGLIKTGPTGTNVNDVSVVLIDRGTER
ncbi:MAG: glycerate kinase [Clostridia bacterium]|nr:glycerate kinase [Clostridia bacterium]